MLLQINTIYLTISNNYFDALVNSKISSTILIKQLSLSWQIERKISLFISFSFSNK